MYSFETAPCEPIGNAYHPIAIRRGRMGALENRVGEVTRNSYRGIASVAAMAVTVNGGLSYSGGKPVMRAGAMARSGLGAGPNLKILKLRRRRS